MLEINPKFDYDCCELLAMSILILNTNIHSDKIPKALKLTKQSFVKTNLHILEDAVSAKFIGEIYDRIDQ